MRSRTNDEWLTELRDEDLHAKAVVDLCTLVQSAMKVVLVDYIEPSDPAFKPLADAYTKETVARVFTDLESYRGRSRFTTWVYKVAVRVVLSDLLDSQHSECVGHRTTKHAEGNINHIQYSKRELL